MPRTLDTLAVELLTMISFYACTDGGQTGCSLSLISKRIRAASRPARFYSVLLLDSPSQIERFLLAYQAECSRAPDALPRVRHLCLSLIGKGVDTPGTSPTPARLATHPKSRAEFIAAMQRRTQLWRTGQESLDEQYNRVVPALMGALATDLHTLSLIQGQWRRGTSMPCYFPSLRELTVVGGDSSFFPFASVPRDRPLYPALERLHHIFAWSNKDVDYRQWAPHAPNVTHLRATRIDCHPRITVDTFQQVVSDAASDEKFFPHLKLVMLKPHPAPPPVRADSGALEAYRGFLGDLQKVAESSRVPVVLLHPPETPSMMPKGSPGPYNQCIMKVRQEWLDRVEGRPACWEEGQHWPVIYARW